MSERFDDRPGRNGAEIPVENAGCAVVGAAVVVACIMTLALAFPLAAPIVFPLALIVALLLGVILGLPLFFAALQLGWANVFTAAVGGFVIGALLAAWVGAPSSDDWQILALFGGGGAAGGVAFWLFLTRW